MGRAARAAGKNARRSPSASDPGYLYERFALVLDVPIFYARPPGVLMTEQANPALANLLTEDRRFPPSQEFAANANFKPEVYEEAREDRLQFWADQARAFLDWETPFTQVLDWSEAPRAQWFADGKLNATYN